MQDGWQGGDGCRSIKEDRPCPKIEVQQSCNSSTLKDMSKFRAFHNDAQFGPMCEDPVKISEVVHQAWVKVAEKGTEAAAATAVIMRAGSAMPVKEEPPKMFIADHPFLYFVIDDRNGGIVFAGSVIDPTK